MLSYRDKIKYAVEILIIAILFIFFSYVAQTNIDPIKNLIGEGIFGMILYTFIITIDVIIAPITATPFIPIASNLWGWVIAGILSSIGWTLGGIFAFMLARVYGTRLIKKMISLERIEKYEELVSKRGLFWSIVFLRMFLPVDILSYALGLFSKMNLSSYVLATFIGVTPFAFIFAYLGAMPISFLIAFFIIALIVMIIWATLRWLRKRRSKK